LQLGFEKIDEREEIGDFWIRAASDCLIFHVPARIIRIIIGYPVDLAADEVLGNILDFFGRDASINYTGLNNRAFKYNSPGGDNRIAADFRMVHDDGTHSYQYMVVNCTAMNNGIVPDRNIVAYDRLGSFKSAMQDRAILYVYFIPYANAVNITSDNGIEPDAAVPSHNDITDNCGIGCNEAVLTPGRVNIPYR